MSTGLAHAAAPARERTRPRPDADRRHLTAVRPSAKRRPRTAYALVAVATLLTIVVAQLLLSITVSHGAFQIERLQAAKTDLTRDYQAVEQEVKKLSSPQNLAANAEALGMVTDASPVYLRLSDGAVLGSPEPASGASGTVTDGSGRMVQNSLLNGVQLVTQPGGPDAAGAAGPASGTDAANPSDESESPAAKDTGPVPLDGALPAPVTH